MVHRPIPLRDPRSQRPHRGDGHCRGSAPMSPATLPDWRPLCCCRRPSPPRHHHRPPSAHRRHHQPPGRRAMSQVLPFPASTVAAPNLRRPTAAAAVTTAVAPTNYVVHPHPLVVMYSCPLPACLVLSAPPLSSSHPPPACLTPPPLPPLPLVLSSAARPPRGNIAAASLLCPPPPLSHSL